MATSTLQKLDPGALHVAVIMDGNGRWAEARGWPRTLGHRAGAEAVRRTVRAAAGLGLGTLTLYAFSSDNWGRPAEEVAALLRLLRGFLRAEIDACARAGIRVEFLGRRDRLPPGLAELVEAAERATAGGGGLRLRLALDYSSRDAIAGAAARVARDPQCPEGAAPEDWRAALAEALRRPAAGGAPAPDVDLLVRTGGEKRLSDFLLWECAYAELLFLRRMWPDFDGRALHQALAEFARRRRRFGRLPAAGDSGRRSA